MSPAIDRLTVNSLIYKTKWAKESKSQQVRRSLKMIFLKDIKAVQSLFKGIFFNITKIILMMIVFACFKRFFFHFSAFFGIFHSRKQYTECNAFSFIFVVVFQFLSFSSMTSKMCRILKVFFFFHLIFCLINSVYIDACWMLTSLRMYSFENVCNLFSLYSSNGQFGCESDFV